MQVYKQRMQSLRELMAQNVARADVDWLVQGDQRFTYGEHDRLARVLAHSLAQLGVHRGDRVALVSANVPEWVITWWACAVLGATLVPLNAWWKAEELEFGLDDSGAKVLIGDARRIAAVRDRLGALAALEHVFVIDGPGDEVVRPFAELDRRPGRPGYAGIADRRGRRARDPLHVGHDGQAQGRDRLAPPGDRERAEHHRHGRRPGDAGHTAAGSRSGLQSCSLLVVPLFHVTGCLSTMTLAYATGAKVVLMPVGRFDPDVAMETIEREKVTRSAASPR